MRKFWAVVLSTVICLNTSSAASVILAEGTEEPQETTGEILAETPEAEEKQEEVTEAPAEPAAEEPEEKPQEEETVKEAEEPAAEADADAAPVEETAPVAEPEAEAAPEETAVAEEPAQEETAAEVIEEPEVTPETVPAETAEAKTEEALEETPEAEVTEESEMPEVLVFESNGVKPEVDPEVIEEMEEIPTLLGDFKSVFRMDESSVKKEYEVGDKFEVSFDYAPEFTTEYITIYVYEADGGRYCESSGEMLVNNSTNLQPRKVVWPWYVLEYADAKKTKYTDGKYEFRYYVKFLKNGKFYEGWLDNTDTVRVGKEKDPFPPIPGANNIFVHLDGKDYWYENSIRQGTIFDPKGVFGDGTNRGREIFDPATNGWYWLDSIYNGAKAVGKEVWMPYIYQNEASLDINTIKKLAAESNTYTEAKDKTTAEMAAQVEYAILNHKGKWVRYDQNGKMMKGWVTIAKDSELAKLYPKQGGNTYYYDYKTGLMAKGWTKIGGKLYLFDEVTGALK